MTSLNHRAVSLAVVATSLVLTLGSAYAQNARHSASRIEPDIGTNIMRIEAPDSAILRDFIVPAYKGRVHFGQPIPEADAKPSHMMRSNEKAAQMRGSYVRTSGLQLYLDLLRLGENRDIMTKDKLKNLYANAKRPLRTDPFMRDWAPHLEFAARGALADGPYREVFCVEESPCPLDRFNGSRPYDIAGMTPVWGAAYNEFRFRAAYALFVEKYAQALIDWGTNLDRAAICTGAMRIGNYDFDKGAYVAHLGCQSRIKLPADGRPDVSTPEYDIVFSTRPEGELSSIVLTWKLPREKAAALREQMQANKTHQLFIVVEGEIGFDPVDRAAMNNPSLLARDHHFILTGDEVLAYFDAGLTKPAGVFKLH